MKGKNDMRIKRKVGAVVVLEIFAALMLAQPVAAATYPTGDEGWVGLTAGGKIVFDETPTPDEIEMVDARVGIGDTSPDFKLEVAGSSGSGYFGVTSSSYLDFLLSGILALFF